MNVTLVTTLFRFFVTVQVVEKYRCNLCNLSLLIFQIYRYIYIGHALYTGVYIAGVLYIVLWWSLGGMFFRLNLKNIETLKLSIYDIFSLYGRPNQDHYSIAYPITRRAWTAPALPIQKLECRRILSRSFSTSRSIALGSSRQCLCQKTSLHSFQGLQARQRLDRSSDPVADPKAA